MHTGELIAGVCILESSLAGELIAGVWDEQGTHILIFGKWTTNMFSLFACVCLYMCVCVCVCSVAKQEDSTEWAALCVSLTGVTISTCRRQSSTALREKPSQHTHTRL